MEWVHVCWIPVAAEVSSVAVGTWANPSVIGASVGGGSFGFSSSIATEESASSLSALGATGTEEGTVWSVNEGLAVGALSVVASASGV